MGASCCSEQQPRRCETLTHSSQSQRHDLHNPTLTLRQTLHRSRHCPRLSTLAESPYILVAIIPPQYCPNIDTDRQTHSCAITTPITTTSRETRPFLADIDPLSHPLGCWQLYPPPPWTQVTCPNRSPLSSSAYTASSMRLACPHTSATRASPRSVPATHQSETIANMTSALRRTFRDTTQPAQYRRKRET
jgi:hypothetical protein